MSFIRSIALSALVLVASAQAFALDAYTNSCRSVVAGEVVTYLRETAGYPESYKLDVVAVKEVSAGATRSGNWYESFNVALDFDGFPVAYIAQLDGNCEVVSLERAPKAPKSSLFKAKVLPSFCETYEPDCDRL